VSLTITPDTNLLVRLIVQDDAEQTRRAQGELERASTVMLTLPALCETFWVLRSHYRLTQAELQQAMTAITEAPNARVDEDAVSTGLAVLREGGDFADGVIAATGAAMGASTFVSFDRQAVRLLNTAGRAARLVA
jgi:predicted nucleic-acid-binding protein